MEFLGEFEYRNYETPAILLEVLDSSYSSYGM